MRLTYCGRRKTPWPSAPRASASAINAATFSASLERSPTAASTLAMKRRNSEIDVTYDTARSNRHYFDRLVHDQLRSRGFAQLLDRRIGRDLAQHQSFRSA